MKHRVAPTPRASGHARANGHAGHTEHADDRPEHIHPTPTAPFATSVGRTRFAVLLAVAAVLLVAVALFVVGAGLALFTVWQTAATILAGQPTPTSLTVQYLEIVSVMLKAVVFYLIGVGLYSLFIAPLNLPTALGVQSLNDLEAKVVSVVVVIMAISFLEHFIVWQKPDEIFQFGIAMALVVPGLVLFQFYSHWATDRQSRYDEVAQVQARRQLFHGDQEQRQIESVSTAHAQARPGHRAGRGHRR